MSTTTIQTIPLNKLILWSGNVRKTDAEHGIDELAASIVSHGLLNPLLVRKDKRGKFAVIAGQRRLLALQALAKDERIDGDHGVECRLANGETNAAELSLAENVVRARMHPADEFEAFRDLIDGGAGVADVAARFGASESLIEKRLRLGRLSPVILAAYRNGDLGLEEAMAFTLGIDHAAQERVFNDLPPFHCRPASIRRALTQGEVPATDRRARLVGLDAYRDAGGIIRRDLFDDEGEGYLQDAVLLDRLAMQRLEDAAQGIKAEGWAWIECVLDLDHGILSRLNRLYPVRAPLADDAQAELDRLQAEYDELAESDDDDSMQRCEQIESRIDALEAASEHWPAETLSIAGAILSIDRDGTIEIRRGLVRPEDARKAKAAAKGTAKSQRDAQPSGEKPLPATLVADLTAHKSAAISAALLKRPDVALAATVHALALDVLYTFGCDSCLRFTAKTTLLATALSDPDTCKAYGVLESERERWLGRLPHDADELWAWCLEQKRAVLLDLLALVAAHSVDAIVPQHERAGSPRLAHADALARAISLDLASWYRPTASGYFGRISRAVIIDAIEDATGKTPAPAWLKLTRTELAKLAEKMIGPTKWLPSCLRIASNDASEPEQLPEAAE